MASKRQYETDSSEEENYVSSDNKNPMPSKKKYAGSFKYKVTFKNEWKALHPVHAVKNDKHKFHCLPCGKNLTCRHQGLKDVEEHCRKESHIKCFASWKKQSQITFTRASDMSSFQSKVLNAEVMVTNFIVQHNLPIATADHLGQLFKNIFPDSKIASSYDCAKTKTFSILNEAFAPQCHSYVVDHCKTHPYGVGHDGSNDTGIQKMNPVAIRIFDVRCSKTVTDVFFNMFRTQGEDKWQGLQDFRVH